MISTWHTSEDRIRNQNVARELGSFKLETWKNFYLNEEKEIKENQFNDSLLFLMASNEKDSIIGQLPKELVLTILTFKTASENRHLNIAKDIFNRSLKYYKKNPILTPSTPLISNKLRFRLNKFIEEKKQEEEQQEKSCCFCQIL